MPTLRIPLQTDRWAVVLTLALAFLLVANIFREVYFQLSADPFAKVLIDKFNFNAELSVPAWYSSPLLLICALLAFAVAQTLRKNSHTDVWRWWVVALMFFAMSADETVAIHEMSGVVLHRFIAPEGVLRFIWVVLAAPFIIGLVVLTWPMMKRLPRPTAKRLVVAASIYFGGAVGVEMIGAKIFDTIGKQTPQYFFVMTVEETMEIAGLSLFVLALMHYLKELVAQPDTAAQTAIVRRRSERPVLATARTLPNRSG